MHCSNCASFWGASYSRPPIPYRPIPHSPLLQNPGGATEPVPYRPIVSLEHIDGLRRYR